MANKTKQKQPQTKDWTVGLAKAIGMFIAMTIFMTLVYGMWMAVLG